MVDGPWGVPKDFIGGMGEFRRINLTPFMMNIKLWI